MSDLLRHSKILFRVTIIGNYSLSINSNNWLNASRAKHFVFYREPSIGSNYSHFFRTDFSLLCQVNRLIETVNSKPR